MRWFADLKTWSKLMVGFGAMIVLMIGIALTGYGALSSTQELERNEVDSSSAALIALLEMRSDQNRIRGVGLEYLIADDDARRSAAVEEIEKRNGEIDRAIAELEHFLSGQDLPEERALLAALKTDLTEYREMGARLRASASRGALKAELDQAEVLQAERFEKLRDKMIAMGAGFERHAEEAVGRSRDLFELSSAVFAAVSGFAVIFAVLMILTMNRLIAVPLHNVTKVAERIADGNLEGRVETSNRRDELGLLESAFALMLEKLRRISDLAEKIAAGDLTVSLGPVGASDGGDQLQRSIGVMLEHLRRTNRELREGMGILTTSSSEILATVSQVSASAHETAASVNETSTTAAEVKQTADLSNQKAKAVQDSALSAAGISDLGKKAVTENLDGMEHIQEQMESIAESVVRLSEQGQAIGEIIASVNDLAEQSNLLAVNAAIEATRAGEYGRGFAVVAQEVKSLADQSRQATTQVRSILMDIQKATSAAVMATEQGSKAVVLGLKQATETGESIQALADAVVEASHAATQIAASSQQQLVGMDQISSAIANIRSATTQNTAGTKQLEASAMSLNELGVRLKSLVEQQQIEA